MCRGDGKEKGKEKVAAEEALADRVATLAARSAVLAWIFSKESQLGSVKSGVSQRRHVLAVGAR